MYQLLHLVAYINIFFKSFIVKQNLIHSLSSIHGIFIQVNFYEQSKKLSKFQFIIHCYFDLIATPLPLQLFYIPQLLVFLSFSLLLNISSILCPLSIFDFLSIILSFFLNSLFSIFFSYNSK